MSGTRPVDRPATWVAAALIAAGFVGVLWVGELVDLALGSPFDQHGIEPRDGEGLLGIVWSPLLHGGLPHLLANTVPALVLGFLTLASGVARGLAVTATIWLLGGLGVWLTAPAGTVTIGASGLIFGWLTYLLVRGFVSGRAGEIILGIVLLLLYGGLLLGVLPGQPGVSWQGHLFGAVAGVLAALWLGERRAPRRASSYDASRW